MSRTTSPSGARTLARSFAFSAIALSSVGILSESASAAFVTLNSPDLRYNMRSSEFGNFGNAWTGGLGRGNFQDGNGLQEFGTASTLLMARSATGSHQWLTNTALVATASPIGGSNIPAGFVTSDITAGNVRTTQFTVPGFTGINVTLRQEAANDGFHQTYTFLSNATTSLTLVDAADMDVPISTALSNRLRVDSPSRLSVFDASETRKVWRYADRNYNGYAAIHHPDGVTGRMFMAGYNAFGIPASGLNAFRTLSEDFDFPALIGNEDTNGDLLTDGLRDVGFHMQYNLALAANQPQSIRITTEISRLPEPTTLAVLAAPAMVLLRRRRKD